MLDNTIIVTFTAPEHSGKTALEVAFARFLQAHGIEVLVPPDQQRDEKMLVPIDELIEVLRKKGVKIMMMESNAT